MLRNLNRILTINGKNGKTYEFNQFSFDSFEDIKGKLPNYGGIYLFTRQEELGQDHEPIYCGKTDNFSERYYNHHAERCIVQNKANRISILRVDNEIIRDNLEVDILEVNTFSCNIQHNG